MMTLKNYSMMPFPGCQQFAVGMRGNVYDDPRGRPDGREICTSAIVDIDDHVITTETGSQYLLEEDIPENLNKIIVRNREIIKTEKSIFNGR